jgi:hypothetical protein
MTKTALKVVDGAPPEPRESPARKALAEAIAARPALEAEAATIDGALRPAHLSNPPPDLAGVGVERRDELAAHLLLLERNMHPICGGEDSGWSNEHGPRANPECDSQCSEDETEIHWIAR